jgi:hypothetical protein
MGETFSVRSVPGLITRTIQVRVAVVGSEKLLGEAEESPLLEAATKQRRVKNEKALCVL